MFINARSAVQSLQNIQVTAFTFTSVNNRFHWLWGRGFKAQASGSNWGF